MGEVVSLSPCSAEDNWAQSSNNNTLLLIRSPSRVRRRPTTDEKISADAYPLRGEVRVVVRSENNLTVTRCCSCLCTRVCNHPQFHSTGTRLPSRTSHSGTACAVHNKSSKRFVFIHTSKMISRYLHVVEGRQEASSCKSTYSRGESPNLITAKS